MLNTRKNAWPVASVYARLERVVTQRITMAMNRLMRAKKLRISLGAALLIEESLNKAWYNGKMAIDAINAMTLF